jgi:aspartyl-tRNA(Asn)/glutamyl-tRNA(Gln) amidotransferase subunit C
MAIPRETVLHVAKLARLELSEGEVTRMVRDLGSIIDHVAELSAVDTADVPPTTWVEVERAPFREDAVAPGVPTEQALAEAPRSGAGGFAVPAFVDEA